MKLNINNNSINNNTLQISKDYIAGFVHADGTFTVPLIKGKKKIYMNPRFILTQSSKYKNHLQLIKKILGDIGYIKENKSTKILKYTVTNLNVIIDNILPLFDKHQLRGNRYYSYLKFKLLVNILKNENIEYKSPLWLFCIKLTTIINPNVKLSKQIRYLTTKEQTIIENNTYIKDIDINALINKYCSELTNINIFENKAEINNSQSLTKDFINGLFDGDGSLTVRLTPINQSRFGLRVDFQIIQDHLNNKVLEEIMEYFNNKGKISPHKIEKSISYFCYSRIDLINSIIPKMLNISDPMNDNIIWEDLTGPCIKLYKFYNLIHICRLLETSSLNNSITLDLVISLIYNIIKNTSGLTINQFKENLFK